MNKIFNLFLILIAALLVSGVTIAGVTQEEIDEFLEKVAEKKGIGKGNIKNIKNVSFEKLPKEVNINNIDDTNLALYEVETTDNESIFIITFSDESIEAVQRAPPSSTYAVSYLNFGTDRQVTGSEFLRTDTGVETSGEKGYVMLRRGSITGISTNLESFRGVGIVHIQISKNGNPVNFENKINVTSSGVKKDYAIQSRGIVEFDEGDVISIYVKNINGVTLRDITTLLEISADL